MSYSAAQAATAVGYSIIGLAVGAYLLASTIFGLIVGLVIREGDRRRPGYCCPVCDLEGDTETQPAR